MAQHRRLDLHTSLCILTVGQVNAPKPQAHMSQYLLYSSTTEATICRTLLHVSYFTLALPAIRQLVIIPLLSEV